MADNLSQEEIQRFADSLRQLSDSIGSTANNIDKLGDSGKKADEDLKKLGDAAKKSAEEFKKSLGQLGSAMMSTSQGMSKYGDGFKSLGGSVAGLVSQFGILGKVTGGLINVFTTVVGAVLKQNDAMLQAADSLAQFGVNGGITSKQILEMGRRAGYSSQELEKYTKITRSLGTDIIALGATATEGAKAFGKITEMDEELLKGYRNLGFSQEAVNQTQADYVKLLTASGISISQNDIASGKLRKGSLQYLDSLIELSALTGMEVEEIKKKQLAAQADVAFQTKMAMMQEEELRLREEYKRTGNESLKVEADKIKAERETKERILAAGVTAGLTGDKLKGLTSWLASGTVNELSASFVRAGVDLGAFEREMAAGRKNEVDFVHMIADANRQVRKNLGDAIVINDKLGAIFLNTTEINALEAKLRGQSVDNQKKIIAEEFALKQQQMANAMDDPAKRARNAQEQLERRMRLTMDSLVGVIQGPVTRAFENLVKLMNSVFRTIAKIAGFVLRDEGLSRMFDTPEEIAKDLEKSSIKLKKAEEEFEKANKGLQESNAFNRAFREAQARDARIRLDQAREENAKLDVRLREREKDLGRAPKEDREAEAERQREARRGTPQTAAPSSAAPSSSPSAPQTAAPASAAPASAAPASAAPASAAPASAAPASAAPAAPSSAAPSKPPAAPGGSVTGGAVPAAQGAAQQTNQPVPGSVSSNLINILKGLEGFSPKAFWDHKQYSIGYGTKANNPNEVISESEAAARLEDHVNRTAEFVSVFGNRNKYKWGQNQLDALTSFVYNGGPGFLHQVTAKGKRSNTEILNAIPLYNTASGKVERGLDKRRKIEAEMFGQDLQARTGGLFDGPQTGYPVMLHGSEMVLPIKNMLEMFNSAKESTTKTELSSIFNSTTNSSDNSGLLEQLIEVMSTKLDSVIQKLGEGVDKQETLIKYTMV